MRLPTFTNTATKVTEVYAPNGIQRNLDDPNKLYDAINLTGIFGCNTRDARSPAMLLKNKPDQVIPCGKKLYFRYGNTLKDIVADLNGGLTEGETSFSLKALDGSPDRIVIPNGELLYVLPDGIQLCNEAEQWHTFGTANTVAVALPFINSRTLYYTSGYAGGAVCDEYYLLKMGDRVKFSWLGNTEFTIIGVDKAYSYTATAKIYEGVRVTLDAPVSKWNSLPSDAVMKCRTPKNRSLAEEVKIGFNESVSFMRDSIRFSADDFEFNLSYGFKESLFVGQTVIISGSKTAENNKTAKITYVDDTFISFDTAFLPSYEDKATQITITPVIPDFDFAVLVDGRLIGADNNTSTFWISRKDKPFVFHTSPEEADASWCCYFEDEITGITVFKDSVMVFTRQGGFRLFGSNALNFSTSQLSICGIEADCFGSLAKVGDTMFYNSSLGIMKSSGSSDRLISAQLKDNLSVKCGVGHKGKYFALANFRIWVYHTDEDIWWSENAEDIENIFTAFGNLYLLTEQTIYNSEGGNFGVEWQFKTAELPKNDTLPIKPISCMLEIGSNNGCEFKVFFKKRGSSMWQALKAYTVSDEKILKIPLVPALCDGFCLKFEGIGDMHITKLKIEYRRL